VLRPSPRLPPIATRQPTPPPLTPLASVDGRPEARTGYSAAMRPAFMKAPFEYGFALATCLFVVVTSLIWVDPPATMWVVFASGMVMTLSVLVVSLWPTRINQSRTDQSGH
jgi:hypothetical protein